MMVRDPHASISKLLRVQTFSIGIWSDPSDSSRRLRFVLGVIHGSASALPAPATRLVGDWSSAAAVFFALGSLVAAFALGSEQAVAHSALLALGGALLGALQWLGHSHPHSAVAGRDLQLQLQLRA